MSLPQKAADGSRTEDEEMMFRCGLKHLDFIYAHIGVITFLFSCIPKAVLEMQVADDATYQGGVLPYHERGWPMFERCQSELCKPSHHCIDMQHLLHVLDEFGTRRDIVENALQQGGSESASTVSVASASREHGVRVGEGRVQDKSLAELASQGTYINSALQGVLLRLVEGNRRPPMAPAIFDEQIKKLTFTNGADRQFVQLLYRRTSTSILKNVKALRFVGLRWDKHDWAQFNAALTHCEQLETLVISYMESLKSAHLLGLFPLLPVTLKTLNLEHCKQLGVLPDLSSLPRLESLVLTGCSILHTLPSSGWRELTALCRVDLFGCELLKYDDIAGIVHLMSVDQVEQLSMIMPEGDVLLPESMQQ